jgi:hypothetical protein
MTIGSGPEIITDMRMPPFGVAETLVDKTEHGPDLFRFWLLSHTDANMIAGPRFWRTGVLRECLPRPEIEMNFVVLAEPLR